MMVAAPHRSDDDFEEPKPPQYTCLKVADEEAADAERAWDALIPRDWPNFRRFNIVFICTPEIFHEHKDFIRRIFRNRKIHPHWRAKLLVKAKNIPRLMRQGFHLSSADLIPGSGEVYLDDRERAEDQQFDSSWRHRRSYHFENATGDLEWKATLEVFARSSATIMNFRLEWVTPDTVSLAHAFHWNMKQVYYADRLCRNSSFNILFNEMPTGGWWPAPKDMKAQKKARFLDLSEQLETKNNR